jgi:DNA-binding transcriptional ArsR family regulator
VNEAATLDVVFSALADPTRRGIVAHLAKRGDASVQELAAPFDISLPAVSRHLKVLEEARLISRSHVGQRRPCHLRIEAFAEVSQWLSHTRTAWQARLDRLDAYLKTLPPDAGTRSKKGRSKRRE